MKQQQIFGLGDCIAIVTAFVIMVTINSMMLWSTAAAWWHYGIAAGPLWLTGATAVAMIISAVMYRVTLAVVTRGFVLQSLGSFGYVTDDDRARTLNTLPSVEMMCTSSEYFDIWTVGGWKQYVLRNTPL